MTKAEIQRIRSLADKRGRDETGLFLAEGEKLIGELRGSGLRIRRIYALKGVLSGEEVEIVSPAEMERISQLKTPSHALAVVEIPRYGFDPKSMRRDLVLALDDVRNPGNLGTIIRLADWFGIRHIVCSETSADCFNPKVVQATMGAILRVRVHYCDLAAWLREESRAGTPVYGTFLEGEDIHTSDLTPEGILVMGNEGHGISQECARSIGRKLFIPPYPSDRHGSESLNVAVATALACGEFRRRIRTARG